MYRKLNLEREVDQMINDMMQKKKDGQDPMPSLYFVANLKLKKGTKKLNM